MKRLNSLLVCMLLCIVVISCKKEVKRHPSGAAVLPGAIKGTVRLYDQSGEQMMSMSGVLVEVQGTGISFTTLEDGKYQLSNIPAGTYNIKYSKKGFGYAIEQVLITGNGTLNKSSVGLHQIPIEVVDVIKYEGYDSLAQAYNFMVSLKANVADAKLSIVLPFSVQPDVNISNPDLKIQYEMAPKVDVNNFINKVARVRLPRTYFAKYYKKIIYLKAFIASGDATVYDPESDLFYYSACSDASPEISFKTL